MSAALPRSALASTFLRSFLIQGSWNYHTMLGCGFAFAMLPGLRALYGAEAQEMAASLGRHVELFNAHPYLSGVALGAVLEMERDGADADAVRRFKLAVRGPLGSLGDSLVWASWLPVISVLALALYWLGLPGWSTVAVFLVVYNVGHVGLRLWGFRVGLAEGRDVGKRLAQAELGAWTNRLRSLGALLLGTLLGVLLAGEGALGDAGVLWVVLALIAFLAGLLVGHRAWRPAAATVVVAIGLLAAVGLVQ
ncbi:MAG TPA: PTS system mannose/fructose/sorbose family transporter subunit IID [Longimicrobiales bacterium]|nr:PTS system mannose/fructose/sorbose family transporter subunit IID [Longimicrobiales bacterium]